MKKSLIIVLCLFVNISLSQRGLKMAYIDTEYILENISEYNDISNQLEKKANEWKNEIEKKSKEIEAMKNALNAERILLTSELIQDLEEDIQFEEEALIEYQQKRFGYNGDYYIQKQQLIQPLQDQIFNAVRKIAENRDYDFIFDKSADFVMIYLNKRYNISDLIIREIKKINKKNNSQ